MKKLITALAVTTALGTGGAMAQYAGSGYGYGNDYYGAGIGGGYGTDLGYGYGYGSGLLGGTIDQSLYGVSTNDLYNAEIQGAGGEKIGDVLNVIRNCNIYAVVSLNPDWMQGVQKDIVVPISNLVVTEKGVIIQNITANNVDQFPTYRAGMNLVEYTSASMGANDTTAGAGNGGMYGATQGWSACQQFSGTGVSGASGFGTGVGAEIGNGGVGVNTGLGTSGAGVGAGAGDTGAGMSIGTAASQTAGGGQGMAQQGSNTLEFRVDALRGSSVYSANGQQIGQIDNLYRSNNAYVVMQIDTGWFSSGGTAIVPMQRFTWVDDELMLPGVTEEMIKNYDPYGGVYGDFWSTGYSEMDTGYYNNVGDIYGYGS